MKIGNEKLKFTTWIHSRLLAFLICKKRPPFIGGLFLNKTKGEKDERNRKKQLLSSQ